MSSASQSEFRGTDRFVIRRRLGEGGMGIVYEAQDLRRQIPVALKTLRRVNAQALYYFKNEFRALADLHHRNLITLYELFCEDGQWFFTMELLDGVDLLAYVIPAPKPEGPITAESPNAPNIPDTLISPPHAPTVAGWAPPSPTPQDSPRPAPPPAMPPRAARPARASQASRASRAPSEAGLRAPPGRARFDETRLRYALAQLALGLTALHDAGKIHRDVKPSNVLVTADGRVVLMDFGLVAGEQHLEELRTSPKIAGTPSYMAPEQASSGINLGPAADWYAVGVILYQALTGALPHTGPSLEAMIAAKLGQAVRPPSARVPGVPADLEQLCVELLARHPASRPTGPQVLDRLGVSRRVSEIRTSASAGPVFVGRERELAALDQRLARSRGGLAAVFVSGPSGIGKSALVDRFLARARTSGATVLRGRCYAEESVPYKAFDGIVDALSRYLNAQPATDQERLLPADAALVGRLFPVLLRVPALAERAQRPTRAITETALAKAAELDEPDEPAAPIQPAAPIAPTGLHTPPAELYAPAAERSGPAELQTTVAERHTSFTARHMSPALQTLPTQIHAPSAGTPARDPTWQNDARGDGGIAPTALMTSHTTDGESTGPIGRLVRAGAAAGDPGTRTSEAISPQQLRSRGFAALIEIFARLAAGGPLVLFIDDVQWADADSLLLLLELLHADDAPPLLLVASVRTGTGLARPDERGTTPLDALPAERLPIEPLTDADADALVQMLLPPGASASERAAIAREAGGHPLFLSELAHHRATATGDATVARLDQALWERVCRLDDEARRIVEIVAIAGLPIAANLAAAAAAVDIATALPVLSALRTAHLVKLAPRDGDHDSVEPYHDRVRESVIAHLSDAARADGSRRLARALLSAGAAESSPELVVRLLLAAGDSDAAGALAERAAERALSALAFDRAAAFLRIALNAVVDAAGARRLHLALGEALANGGRGPEAAEAFLAAARARSSDDEDDSGDDSFVDARGDDSFVDARGDDSFVDARGDDSFVDANRINSAAITAFDCRRRAAEQLLASGHVDRGLAELRGVLEALGEAFPKSPAAALTSVEQQRAAITDALDREATGELLAVAERSTPALLRRIDVFQTTSLGLILVDNIRGAHFQARALRLALAANEPLRLLRALVFEAIYRAQESADGRAQADRLLARARVIPLPVGDPRPAAYQSLGAAFGAYYRGHYRDAVVRFRDAAEQFRALPGVAWENNTIRLHILRAIDYQGAWGELRTLYDEYIRDAQRRNDRYVEASLNRWFNVLWLAHDQPDRAGADLDRKLWTPPEEGRYHLQHFLELRARVELALYRGDGAAQGAWARPGLDAADRSLLLRIQVAQAIADWLRGRIAACEGDAAETDAMAEALEAQNIAYASIWAGLLRGAAAARRGDTAGAIAVLRDCAALADASDFPLCATIARLRIGQLRGGGDGRQQVAEAERWMRSQDIRAPARMAEVFAPGY